MIYQGSRYETAIVAVIPTDRGDTATVFRTIPQPSPTAEIRVGDYDTMQTIAARAYGDPELWWHIADANPDLLYPDDIPAGAVIKVPYVSTLR